MMLAFNGVALQAQESREGCASQVTQRTPPALEFGIRIDPTQDLRRQGEQLRAYASALDDRGYFESGVRGTKDKQWLDEPLEGSRSRTVPEVRCLGTIWPEMHAHKNWGQDLRRVPGEGRITAKFKIEHCDGYEQGRFTLPPGVSYLWVDSFQQPADSATQTTVRMALIPYPEGEIQVHDSVKVCWHRDYGYEHAHARWLFDEDDARSWLTCVEYGCCEPS